MVKDTARQIDLISDKNLKAQSENFQASIVEHILLPLSKELLKENPETWEMLIMKAKKIS